MSEDEEGLRCVESKGNSELYVDVKNQESVLFVESRTEDRSILLPQDFKDRVFGSYYGKWLTCKYSMTKCEGVWSSNYLISKTEIESSPTKLVGVLRKLVRLWRALWGI